MTDTAVPIKDFKTLTFGQSCAEIIKIAFPIFIFVLAEMGMVSIDIIMVGKLGEIELAALGVAGAYYEVLMMLVLGATGLSLGLMSQSLAQNNHRHTQDTINALIAMTCLLTVLVFLPTLFSSIVYDALEQPKDLKPMFLEYLDIRRWGLPILCFLAVYRNMFNAYRIDFMMPLSGVLIPTLNILFNYMLIYGNWGAPELGIAGAAYASNITDIIMIILFIAVLRVHPRSKSYSFFFHGVQVKWQRLKHTLTVSAPIAVSYVSEMLLWSFSTVAVGWIGTQAMTVHQSVISILYIVATFPIALGVTVMMVTGNLAGKRDLKTLRTLPWIAIVCMTSFATVLGGIIMTFQNNIIPTLFPAMNMDTLTMANDLLPYVYWLTVFYGMQYILSSLLKGINKSNDILFIYIVFYLLLGIGVCYVLSQTLGMGIDGVWWGMITAAVINGIICLWRYMYTTKNTITAFKNINYADE